VVLDTHILKTSPNGSTFVNFAQLTLGKSLGKLCEVSHRYATALGAVEL